jgi:hypothetical protein
MTSWMSCCAACKPLATAAGQPATTGKPGAGVQLQTIYSRTPGPA